ncbi:MAG TPA: insulinase family protein [Planctomycetota bacterium]|nr:insulinase family protein [Planctomycetota bacterium]
MRSRFFALVLVLLAVAAPARAEDRPLPTDPDVVTGRLDNGLSYLVRRHEVPPGRAVIWLHMGTGSLNETDRQRGLAHYLEHMAFNGSENFKPGTLVDFFQSLGMQFGRDQNAFTNMEQTTYQLSLPDAGPETLRKGLLFFADVLFRLSLAPEEIDAERQIILEERRRGLSARQRVGDYLMEHIAPGSLYGQRDTIGTEESIEGATRQDFLDYYGTWYCASNATLMVVLDADPQDAVKAIREQFAGAPAKPRPAGQDPGVKAYEKSFALVASDPELTSEEVQIMRLEPARAPAATVEAWRDDLVLDLGVVAMNRRLERKLEAGGTSWLGGRVSAGNEGRALHSWELNGRAAPGRWKEALAELALELQRARAFGFTEHEIDAVRKQVLSNAERAVETESTMPSSALIRRMNASVTSGEPMLAPSQRLALLREELPGITPEDVAKRFAREFDPAAVAFVATLPAGPSVPTEAQLLEIGTAALAKKPTRDAEVARAKELLPVLPEPGKVTEEEDHAASGVWSAWLSDNARMRFRFMDDRKNDVTVTVTLIGGDLLETAADRGITEAAQVAWSHPATKHLSSADIRDLMTGKKVDVRGGGSGGGGRRGRGRRGGGGGTPGTISLAISGSPEDLETGFQLAHLLLTEPRIEEASFRQFQVATKQLLEESLSSPFGVGMRAAGSLPFPDDEPRTRPLTAEEIDRLTLVASQAWLEKLVAESPIEIAIVGDLPRERAVALAARYLGSLPSRKRVAPDTFLDLRTLKRPKGPRTFEQEIDSPTPQAFVHSGFYGPDESDLADARAMGMAARILSTRMIAEVREKDQLVYSIGASSRAGMTFPGFGVFAAGAPTEPSKAARLVEVLASMYAAFAKSGPTEDELAVAKRQIANTYDEQVKDPGWWLSRLQLLTWRGESLDDVVNGPAAYQALTAKQVRETFAKYYDPRNAIVVVVSPRGGKEGGGGEGGEGK